MDSLKRKHSDDSSAALYSNKSRARAPVEARVDPTYGQRSALPGLDDGAISVGDEDYINYDDGLDAIAYLRAVRQEATTIPNLLVAPKTQSTADNFDVYNDGVGDFRGWYEDGAYVASNDFQSTNSVDEDNDCLDQQALYYESILSRFEALRVQLQQTPPHELVAALDRDHPIHTGRLTSKLAKWWIWHMRNTPPIPVQVASMDKPTVLRLLGLLAQGTVLKRNLRVKISLSRWIWSLLARLPDRGALTSEEIGVVRDLGKKAVLVGVSLKERKDWEAGIQQVEAGMDGDFEDDEILDVVNEDEIDLGTAEELGDQDESLYEGMIFEETEAVQDGSNLLQRADTLTQEGNSGRMPRLETTHITEDANIQSQVGHSREIPPSGIQSTSDTPPSPTSTQERTEDIEAIKARLLSRLDQDIIVEINLEPEVSPPQQISESEGTPERDVAPKWNAQATIDMILTIAGEAYGQRDLLEFRGDWGELL